MSKDSSSIAVLSSGSGSPDSEQMGFTMLQNVYSLPVDTASEEVNQRRPWHDIKYLTLFLFDTSSNTVSRVAPILVVRVNMLETESFTSV